jgi:hypothetical protein
MVRTRPGPHDARGGRGLAVARIPEGGERRGPGRPARRCGERGCGERRHPRALAREPARGAVPVRAVGEAVRLFAGSCARSSSPPGRVGR